MNAGLELTTRSTLSARAKDLVPLLDAHADAGDEQGVLAGEVVAALHRDELFSMWVPACLGGAELDPVHSLEVIENLSYGDPSAGWVVMAASLSIGTGAAYLGDAAVEELFGDGRFPVIAGQGTRPGTALTTDGGFVLSGSWGFASGIKHATHIHTLGVIEETGELIALIQTKVGWPGSQATSAAFHEDLARAEATYRSAHALVTEVWAEAQTSLDRGEPPTVRQHTLIRLALAHLTGALHDVANAVYLASGTTGLRRGTIQRLLRDVHAGTQHVTSAPAVLQSCGRELAGLAPGCTWRFLDLVEPA